MSQPTKPVIFTVDDDPQVLGAVRRDLRSAYAGDYRILAAASGAEALGIIDSLLARADNIALFLVDQRMPAMTGVEFLLEAVSHFPDAKRVLLTAYARRPRSAPRHRGPRALPPRREPSPADRRSARPAARCRAASPAGPRRAAGPRPAAGVSGAAGSRSAAANS